MPINPGPIDAGAIEAAIAQALEDFYRSLIAKIDSIDAKDVMRRKNPYLFRAKAVQSAAEMMELILAATVSSSEETIFGNCFFEPIATAASGGQKALAEGVDIMVQNDAENSVTAIAVKSGPSVFNAASKKKQEQNFTAARSLASQAKRAYRAVIGYGYGRKKAGAGVAHIYEELAGQAFWQELTGDPQFYVRLIQYMGTLPEQYLERYKTAYARASNRLLREFTREFCHEDGSIAWEAILRFNSGSDA
ncbi:MAG: hypothetical protein K6E40_15800 [Desulfovibrio sp.]|nr:hypothetical protein [Desulfovibrio sp.]